MASGASTPTGSSRALLLDDRATNKLWRRSFWDAQGLRFPEDVWSEDTGVVLRVQARARSVDVLAAPVYHWRLRAGESAAPVRLDTIEAVHALLAEEGPRGAAAWYGGGCCGLRRRRTRFTVTDPRTRLVSTSGGGFLELAADDDGSVRMRPRPAHAVLRAYRLAREARTRLAGGPGTQETWELSLVGATTQVPIAYPEDRPPQQYTVDGLRLTLCSGRTGEAVLVDRQISHRPTAEAARVAAAARRRAGSSASASGR